MANDYRVEIGDTRGKWSVIAPATDEDAALKWMRDAAAANPGKRARVLSPSGEVVAIDTSAEVL